MKNNIRPDSSFYHLVSSICSLQQEIACCWTAEQGNTKRDISCISWTWVMEVRIMWRSKTWQGRGEAGKDMCFKPPGEWVRKAIVWPSVLWGEREDQGEVRGRRSSLRRYMCYLKTYVIEWRGKLVYLRDSVFWWWRRSRRGKREEEREEVLYMCSKTA